MQDKSWLLNPSAIAAAKLCIKTVESELGVKLKLSHPQFLVMLKEYTELTDSAELGKAFSNLMSHAGEALSGHTGSDKEKRNVVPLKTQDESAPDCTEDTQETVEYHGKQYLRWHQGKEFRGLYRGQPRYA